MTLRSALAIGTAFLALTACATPQLDDRHMIADETRSEPTRLRLGDVIWLTTQIKGFVTNTSGAGGQAENAYPPWSETIRLPLRHVNDALTADEANLLTAFLAAGTSTHGAGDAAADLEADRTLLWNALVDTLELSPQSTPEPAAHGASPAQLQVRMGDVSVNGETIPGFCSRFAVIVEQQETMTAAFFVRECASAPQRTRELRGINPTTPLGAVTLDRVNLPHSDYFQGITVVTSVARVERAGAAMGNRSESEARWSLAEWEASGICADGSNNPLSIIAVTLRRQPMRYLRIVPTDGRPRYVINSVHATGEREVTAVAHGRWETLSSESLRYLTPRDVGTIQWGVTPQGPPPNIQVPLSPHARPACQPRI